MKIIEDFLSRIGVKLEDCSAPFIEAAKKAKSDAEQRSLIDNFDKYHDFDDETPKPKVKKVKQEPKKNTPHAGFGEYNEDKFNAAKDISIKKKGSVGGYTHE